MATNSVILSAILDGLDKVGAKLSSAASWTWQAIILDWRWVWYLAGVVTGVYGQRAFEAVRALLERWHIIG